MLDPVEEAWKNILARANDKSIPDSELSKHELRVRNGDMSARPKGIYESDSYYTPPPTDNYDPYENVSYQRSNVAAHGQTKGHLVTFCQAMMVVGALVSTVNIRAGGLIFFGSLIGIAILTH